MISFELYSLNITKKAQKSVDAISEPEHSKVVVAIAGLTSKKLQLLSIKKLQGYEDLYRLKIENYRVVFLVVHDTKSLLVVLVGHRKDVYNRLSNMM